MAAVTCKSSSQGLVLILLASAWDQSIPFFGVCELEQDQKVDLSFPNCTYTSKRSELKMNLYFSFWQFFKRSVYSLGLAGAKQTRPQEICEKSDETVRIYLLPCLPFCPCIPIAYLLFGFLAINKWVLFSYIKNIKPIFWQHQNIELSELNCRDHFWEFRPAEDLSQRV